MTKETKKPKAKRILKDFDFSGADSHLALVHKDQGGPANGADYILALKANKFSPEFIAKAQQIQVTLQLPDFLQKFFGLWYDDAEVLARLMGYVPPEQEDEDWSYEDWIQEKVDSYVILKSLHESKNLADSLVKLTEDEYLSVLQGQELLEKALQEFTSKPEILEGDTSPTNEVKLVEGTPSKKNVNKGKKMDQKDQKQEVQNTPEMVEKSVLTAIEKAMEEKQVALEKALAQVAQFEEAQKQAVIKSKTDAVKAVVKDEAQAAVVLKAALALEAQEDFDALVEVFKSLNAKLEQSDLFVETGASGAAAEDAGKESKLVQAIKSKYNKQ